VVSVSSGKAYDVVTAAESAEYYIDRTYTIAGFGGAVEVATVTMEYDQLNRMTKYTGPEGTEEFAYRGAEWHRCGADTTGFMYDGDNVVADVVGGDVDRTYVTPFLDENLSMTASGASYYYSQDGLGSVRTVTDASAGIQNQYDYLAFGARHHPNAQGTIKQRYLYAARERNKVSGQHYMRHRIQSPITGRFGSRDPLRYVANRNGNLYCYVRNRPTNWRDPYGLLGEGVRHICRAMELTPTCGKEGESKEACVERINEWESDMRDLLNKAVNAELAMVKAYLAERNYLDGKVRGWEAIDMGWKALAITAGVGAVGGVVGGIAAEAEATGHALIAASTVETVVPISETVASSMAIAYTLEAGHIGLEVWHAEHFGSEVSHFLEDVGERYPEVGAVFNQLHMALGLAGKKIRATAEAYRAACPCCPKQEE